MPRTQYLLRFDDICPTMDWNTWAEIESTLRAHDIKPIMAVVPDNQDRNLKVNPPVADFWERVRDWQASGWPIALHGYQHKYVGKCPGIVTTNKWTEFAGVPAGEQEQKLRLGIEIFKKHGVRPKLWVAPSNSFDATTVSLLAKLGIRTISDGHFWEPFVCHQDVMWLPQQLFQFRPAPPGVWTVCYHHNNWTPYQLQDFKNQVAQFRGQIASVDDALSRCCGRGSGFSRWIYTKPRLSQLVVRCQLKAWSLLGPRLSGNAVTPVPILRSN